MSTSFVEPEGYRLQRCPPPAHIQSSMNPVAVPSLPLHCLPIYAWILQVGFLFCWFPFQNYCCSSHIHRVCCTPLPLSTDVPVLSLSSSAKQAASLQPNAMAVLHSASAKRRSCRREKRPIPPPDRVRTKCHSFHGERRILLLLFTISAWNRNAHMGRNCSVCGMASC